MSEYRYEIELKPLSEELGGGWLAVVPQLPGCKSDGETAVEALQNAIDAIGCWIEGTTEMGRPIPQPKPTDGTPKELRAAIDSITRAMNKVVDAVGSEPDDFVKEASRRLLSRIHW